MEGMRLFTDTMTRRLEKQTDEVGEVMVDHVEDMQEQLQDVWDYLAINPSVQAICTLDVYTAQTWRGVLLLMNVLNDEMTHR